MHKLVVLLSALAVAAAKPSATLGISAWGAPGVVSAYSTSVYGGHVAAPLVSTYAAAPLVSTYAAGPLALDRNTPATVLNAVGRPLDTIDVVNDRVLHYQAKALTAHGIQKRSVVAPFAYSTYAGATPFVSTYAATPLVSTYAAAPLALDRNTPATVLNAVGRPLDTVDVVNARALHYQAKALSAHGIQKRSVVAAAPLAYSSVVSPLATHAYAASPLVAAAPVVSSYSAYSAPAVVAAAPVVRSYSAYSAPAVVAAAPVHGYSYY